MTFVTPTRATPTRKINGHKARYHPGRSAFDGRWTCEYCGDTHEAVHSFANPCEGGKGAKQ